MMEYHVPVMLAECLEGLNIKSDGVYIDLTFGGGGHTKAILEKIDTGHVYAFDQDDDARLNAEKIDHSSFTFIQTNFRYFKKYLKLHGIRKVDGILADLGVSSHQINEAERGFSTRFDGPLDMRMDRDIHATAQSILDEYSEKDLHRILGMYGEVRNAKSLAAAIVAQRFKSRVDSIAAFKEVLKPLAPRGRENKYFAQVFQALRIEVNEELKVLEEALIDCESTMNEGGRLVVMSYHSLEDRIVKNYINKGKFQGEVEKDFFGNLLRPFQPITRKPITASDEEIKLNNRARSSKLRIAEKI